MYAAAAAAGTRLWTTRPPPLVPVLLALFLALLPQRARPEVLTPPYFNLAEGRRITATATCGEGTQGPELYCKLVGANSERNVDYEGNLVIQGQVSDRGGFGASIPRGGGCGVEPGVGFGWTTLDGPTPPDSCGGEEVPIG